MNSKCTYIGGEKHMKIIDGGVTSAKGFEAASAAAGIKYQGRTDMAMIYSKKPCKTAGAFTTNLVKAAPVIWDKTVVESGVKSHVVVVNSGIANACTGEEGLRYCSETAKKAAEVMGVDANGVLIGSTGVIGMQMPMDKVTAGIEKLANTKQATREAGHLAAKAIMTTDTKEKEIAVTIEIGGKTVTVGGMAKGSGMIHPNMATMLSFITTDLNIDAKLLKEALKSSVDISYNRVSVDGDSSTNDMVVILANGLANNDNINEKDHNYYTFLEALNTLNIHLAKEIAKDGEGATKLIECNVSGCKNEKSAEILAKSVINSSLVKTAIFGSDANWGRVLCALGYANTEFNPNLVTVEFACETDSILVCANGCYVEFDEGKAKEILLKDDVKININLHSGNASATAWGCDLTYDYVKINGDYRS